MPPGQDSTFPTPAETANRLHAAAIHLLRRLRLEDEATGLSAPRLSALSVVVHAGPISIGELATAEQVSPPTISRLVKGLEEEGLVERKGDERDGRVRLVLPTPEGRRILEEGRRRRVSKLSMEVERLSPPERELLGCAAELLEALALPPDHPGNHRVPET